MGITVNRNAFLNKLIPTLVELRKDRREQIENILINEYNRSDAENIYDCVNTIIDRVYFLDEDFDNLSEDIWIRPTKDNLSCFDEIEQSELKITALEMAVYIRSLLNEYSRFPLFKRALFVFNDEMVDYAQACEEKRIFHFKHNGKSHRAFAYGYQLGYVNDQTNYLIMFDIGDNIVRAVPLHEISETYIVQQKFKSKNIELLINTLENFMVDYQFDKEIAMEGI